MFYQSIKHIITTKCELYFAFKQQKFERHETAGRILGPNERREERKKLTGSRLDKKLKKYSTNFLEIFNFFLNSYRKGLLTFCGSDLSNITIGQHPDADDARLNFRKFDNGQYAVNAICHEFYSRHPNIIRAVIIGKKSWGLHLNMWIDGVVEGSFRIQEFVDDFEKHGITIPESLLQDFKNRVYKKMMNK